MEAEPNEKKNPRNIIYTKANYPHHSKYRKEGLVTHWNNNITHYLCWSRFMPEFSRVYFGFAKSTYSNS